MSHACYKYMCINTSVSKNMRLNHIHDVSGICLFPSRELNIITVSKTVHHCVFKLDLDLPFGTNNVTTWYTTLRVCFNINGYTDKRDKTFKYIRLTLVVQISIIKVYA